jgi:hypothetical protein
MDANAFHLHCKLYANAYTKKRKQTKKMISPFTPLEKENK